MACKWTEEMDRFILDRVPCKESCDKTLLLLELNERFGTHFTRYALTTHLVDKRIRCGIHPYNNRELRKDKNYNSRPLFTERKAKGMIRIKVAEPNVWKQKNVYIYEQAHNCIVPKGCRVMFLNTDINDFRPENLYMVTAAEQLLINRHFGGLSTDPEESISRILQVKIMAARHKLAEKYGEVNTGGVIKSDAKETYLKYRQNPEWVAKANQKSREWQKKKYQDPVYRAEYLRRQNERRRKKNKSKESKKDD